MSLLRACRLRPSCLRPRTTQTARMSSLPGSETLIDSTSTPSLAESSAAQPSASTSQADGGYFDALAPETSSESGPPVGNAYPPPQPDANPLRAKPKEKENHKYNLYVQSTRNNTIATFTRPNGNPITTVSGGKCGFKGVRKSSYEAGYQCAVTMFSKILAMREKEGSNMKLEVLFSGFGQGRDAMYRALMAEEGADVRKLVSRVTDTTPIKIGGTRAQKARRI
ncbi:hypothetical protein QCA50_000241 [Cerrena zonata]|uniref:Translational machinery component n=1 Tax=Cerrena zonata TaxID=2478898 RepID=A0AAW0GZI0_9APHY